MKGATAVVKDDMHQHNIESSIYLSRVSRRTDEIGADIVRVAWTPSKSSLAPSTKRRIFRLLFGNAAFPY